MSLNGAMLAQVRDEIAAALAAHEGIAGLGAVADKDVTQLKRENTGLRNRMKDLEERVARLEDRLSAPAVTATAQTAEVSSTVQET